MAGAVIFTHRAKNHPFGCSRSLLADNPPATKFQKKVASLWRREFLRVQKHLVCLQSRRNVSPCVGNEQETWVRVCAIHKKRESARVQSNRNVSPRVRNQQRTSLTPQLNLSRNIMYPTTSFLSAINNERHYPPTPPPPPPRVKYLIKCFQEHHPPKTSFLFAINNERHYPPPPPPHPPTPEKASSL